jgi:hypothetical protein
MKGKIRVNPNVPCYSQKGEMFNSNCSFNKALPTLFALANCNFRECLFYVLSELGEAPLLTERSLIVQS